MNFSDDDEDAPLGLPDSSSEEEDDAHDVAMPPAPAPAPAPAPGSGPMDLMEERAFSKQRISPLQGPWLMKGDTFEGAAKESPKLYVAQTSLRHPNTGQRLPQYGVYCRETVRAGSFLCVFTGTFMPKSKFDRMTHNKNHAMRRHAVEMHFRGIDGRKEEPQVLYAIPANPKLNETLNALATLPFAFAARHVAQCLNEPPEGTTANAKFFVHSYEHAPGEYYSAVLVYAASTIRAGKEIFLHYGTDYEEERQRNKYVAGAPAPDSPWDEGAIVHNPSMDDVIEAIVEHDERIDEILWKERDFGSSDEDEE